MRAESPDEEAPGTPPSRPPLHGRARRRDRGRLAGPLGAGRHLPRPQPRRARWPTASSGSHDRQKLYVLDMFPYPSGKGLHVGHPLGYIGTDVYARYKRMTGHNVIHAMGYDAFGLPAEQYAVETGQHPRTTTDANVANMRRQLRRLGLGHDPRRSVATTDVTFYRWTQWIFLQIFESWYDRDADRARPIRELEAELAAGTREPAARHEPVRPAVGGAVRGRAAPGRRRPPPRVPARGPGQLVPGARHGAGQRGGHRRRPLRSGQLPGVPASAQAVDDADHRLRRPPHRRPRPARVDRLHQADAAQLDRPQRGRRRALRHRRRRRSPCSPPGPTRCSAPPTWCSRPSTRSSTSSWPTPGPRAPIRGGRVGPPPRARRSRPTAPRPAARASSTARPTTARRPASSSAPPPPTR